MVCLKGSESDMVGWTSLDGVNASEFRDRDLGDMLTAIAIGPLTREEGKRNFGHMPLA